LRILQRARGRRSECLGIWHIGGWHRHGKVDDAKMRASREPMTVLQLKRSMDARFRRLEHRLDRRFATKDDLRQFATKQALLETEERLKRHLSVMIESIHDDMRMFAEAIGAHTEHLGDHERRLRKLERLT